MKTVFHVLSGADLYEVALQGRLIVRITCYLNSSQHFYEIRDWEALNDDAKNKIETKAKELITSNA